jgi:hypothetical protein
MYCPKCRAEFQDGFSFCRNCNEELVEQLPPEPQTQNSNKPSLILKFDTVIEKTLKLGSMIYVIIGILSDVIYAGNHYINVPTYTILIYLCRDIVVTILRGLLYYGLGRIIELLREGFQNEK